jgi:ribosomal protein S18 acetylase RimI-like enzyme
MLDTKQSLLFENTPKIPGLAFRGFNGEADFAHMAEIINAANLADKEDEIVTVEDIALNYAHLQRSDTTKDMLFIEVDGKPVGYGRCMWDAEPNNDHFYGFFLHLKPEWRDKGLEMPVFEHFIRRLKEIAAEHPADAPKYFQIWNNTEGIWLKRYLEQLGFEPVRYAISMVRPCSQPIEVQPLPEGVEVQPVDESQLRAIFDAESEAFRDHWGYIEPTEKDYQRWLADPLNNPALWQVAWDGDEVVGMVRNFIHEEENQTFKRKRGYTENISVRRPWRRKGVARALLTRSIHMFQEMGMEETVLGVDTENPNGALKLYQSVGYQEFKRYETLRKPLTL